MSRTKPDQLQKALEGILKAYGDDVNDAMKECVKEATKEGVKMIKKAAKDTAFSDRDRTGEYAKSWTSQVETGRTSAQGTIYSKKPGLPHLLENGHMMANGKFWSGKKHIGAVQDEVAETMEKLLGEKI